MYSQPNWLPLLLILPQIISTECRLQDFKQIPQLAVIPNAESPFWGVCSKSLDATSASHITLAMAVPRAAIDADFVYTLTGRLGAITVIDARKMRIVGRQVVALLVKNKETLVKLITKNPSLWWSLSYYVLSVPSLDETYTKICRTLWDRYRVRNIILVVDGWKNVVATYNPFVDDSEGGKLTTKEVKEFSFVEEQYSGLLNLHKLPVRVTMFPSIPTAVPQPDGTFFGYDGMILRTAAEMMNFTPVVTGPSDGDFYSSRRSDGSYTGAVRDILLEKSDVAFNGHFIQDHQSDRLDFTTHVSENKVCFIVPKAGTMPRVITILNCFKPSVWMSIIMAYLIFTVAYHVWQIISHLHFRERHTDLSGTFIQSIGIFLNMPSGVVHRLDSGKILVTSFILMCFVLIQEFEGTFLTFLNRPISYKDIDTLDELESSGLLIRTSFRKVEDTLGQDPTMTGIVRNMEVVRNDGSNASIATSGALSQTGGTGGLMRVDSFKAKYLQDFVKVNSSQPLHVVKECPLSYFIAYVVPRGSPLLDSFNTIIARCVTAGLIGKWSWDTNYATFTEMHPVKKGESSDEHYESFSLSDLQFPFFVWIAGILVSVFTFLGELLSYRIQNNIRVNSISYPNKLTLYFNEFPPDIKPSPIVGI